MTCYVGGMQRFSTEDGPGIRTTVFLKGCPLNCAWCHNPELISRNFYIMYRENMCIRCGTCIDVCPEKAISYEDGDIVIDHSLCNGCLRCIEQCCSESLYTKSNLLSVEDVMNEVEKDREFYENSGGGVTLSGGEILFNADFACAVAKECVERKITVVADTSGFGRYEDLLRLAELSVKILYDLKSMDKEQHKELTGVDPTLIWENLKKLARDDAQRKKVIIRVPLIGGVNDTEENLQRLLRFMKENHLPEVNFLPYHNMGVSKARRVGIVQKQYETPSDDRLEKIREMFSNQGIRTVVMGKEE